jgi:alpha-tubulin suppressor-like RCC1 family protein
LVDLPGSTGPATQIAAGGDFSLVLTSSGQLYSFGGNVSGQLGRAANTGQTGTSGLGTPNPVPMLVSLPGATGRISQIAAGGGHSLVVTSTGQLYSFGNNGVGQLGQPVTAPGYEATPALVSLPGATGGVAQVAAGAGHSLVLTSTGQLYSFGNNQEGELGHAGNIGGVDTSDNALPNPTPALVNLPTGIGRVIQIAAGEQYSLAVTSTGKVYSWGDNGWGELGRTPTRSTGDATFRESTHGHLVRPTIILYAHATPMPVRLPAGTIISSIARGPEANHALAIGTDPAAASLRRQLVPTTEATNISRLLFTTTTKRRTTRTPQSVLRAAAPRKRPLSHRDDRRWRAG